MTTVLSPKLLKAIHTDLWPSPTKFTFADLKELGLAGVDLSKVWDLSRHLKDEEAFGISWYPSVDEVDNMAVYHPGDLWLVAKLREPKLPEKMVMEIAGRAIDAKGIQPVSKSLPEVVARVPLLGSLYGGTEPDDCLCFVSELKEYIEVLTKILNDQNRESAS